MTEGPIFDYDDNSSFIDYDSSLPEEISSGVICRVTDGLQAVGLEVKIIEKGEKSGYWRVRVWTDTKTWSANVIEINESNLAIVDSEVN